MKNSPPGHACVDEVHSIRSNMKKAMNKTDFYSSIGSITILIQVNPTLNSFFLKLSCKPCQTKAAYCCRWLGEHLTQPSAEVAFRWIFPTSEGKGDMSGLI
ncbi:hypothetical protein AVEN_200946-1 [Araneus ventricosus]|uniref:Uncharacterized protein n=1 Tax=Araneus ventricosus TaxID=182803 RepID=A0A4Y2MMF1_ARAVE|nr:hypothetical protein AVEN_200946-1 [Araneus ventricosus]